MLRRRSFTLIELVAVITIAALAVGISSTAMRRSSGAAAFENSVLTFRQFCTGARAQAAEFGRDRVIYYLPDERIFRTGDPEPVRIDPEAITQMEPPDEVLNGRAAPGAALPEEEEGRQPTPLRWKLPENYLMESDEEGSGTFRVLGESGVFGEQLEVFRFYPDGGASGLREFRLTSGKLTKILKISALTGKLETVTEEAL